MTLSLEQPATARFLARHLYRFFVADEPHVSTWSVTPPIDPEAIELLVDAYHESGGDIRSILRVLFNSEFFKNAQFARVKSPAELIVGTVRMAGNYNGFKPGFNNLALECGWQGQELLNPSQRGGMAHRLRMDRPWSFDAPGEFCGEDTRRHLAARRAGHHHAGIGECPGAGGQIPRRRSSRPALTRWDRWKSARRPTAELLFHAEKCGDLAFGTREELNATFRNVSRILTLIAASRDYQFA